MIQQLINLKENKHIKIAKNNATIVNIKEYKNDLLDKKIERKLLKSEENIETGKVRDAFEVFEEWKLKYGI